MTSKTFIEKDVLSWILSKPWTKFYDDYVPKEIEIKEDVAHEIFRRVASEERNRIFLIFFNKNYSYGEIDLLSDAVAKMLIDDGFEKGDVAAIMMPNSPQFAITLLGILKAGGVATPMNPLYTPSEMLHQLSDSEAKYLFILDLFYSKYKEIEDKINLRKVYVTSIADALGFPLNTLYRLKEKPPKIPETNKINNFIPRINRIKRDLEKKIIKPPRIDVAPEDKALIMYTGGTTGVPKGAVILHRNIVSNMQQVEMWHPPRPDGTRRGYMIAGVLPWFHIYGLITVFFIGYYTRSTIVVFPRWDLERVLREIERRKIELLHGVPTIYTYIVNSPLAKKYNLRSLIASISGAAPLPVEILKKYEELTGAKLREGYGLTETSVVTHVNPLYGKYKPGSIGVPIPNTYAAIADPEQPRLLPPGEIGEIVISGPQVFAGYHKKPEENAKAFFELGGLRWFRTGDLGYVDEEGYFYVVDRKKDMIKYKGYSVYPREIEEVLYKHEAVAEAAVVGLKDPTGIAGEIPIAFVVLKRGYENKVSENDIIEFLKRHVAAYKLPKKILFVDQLPKSAVGKILKREIRDKAKISLVGEEIKVEYPS